MKSQAIKNSSSKGSKAGDKVFVGLSGGVDSSVSAGLLKEAGFDVTGVFIKVWQPDWIECTWKEDRRDAMRVCAKLDIPFITLDLEKEYKKEVIDYMISEYSIGRTPNPDVMCNKSVKFGAFYDWAMKNGADYVATGHYARVAKDEKTNSFNLLAGEDDNKDQSYFLWNIKREQLPHILFPVGNIEKPEVRKLAKKFDLPTAEKKDSQGLCFIGKIDVKDFLSKYIKQEKGDVLDTKGKVIGSHPGALLMTIGERHGFTIEKKSPNESRLFIMSKDIDKNTITVSSDPGNDILGQKREISISKTNWISEISAGDVVKARIRYRQPLQDAVVKSLSGNTAVMEFTEVQPTATTGQSLVVYKGDVCVGGGVIE